ncbi:MAG: type II toxin-antitoxin system VapC family toxin [Candidatus Omnitrophota bacterium]
MHKRRVYVDTSVFGGVFDKEFDVPSHRFFELVRKERFLLVVSPTIHAEIEFAPAQVKKFFQEMLSYADELDVTEEALVLSRAYLKQNIIPQACADDALHVALATVSGCKMIVSWNFKHIVHFQRIPLYNAINIMHGYHEIGIFSPQEVMNYEEDI